MILIQSAGYDVSTTAVIKWLYNAGEDFLRINNRKAIQDIRYKDGRFIFYIQHKEIDLNNIEAYWYRRGEVRIGPQKIKTSSRAFNRYMDGYLEGEISSVNDFLYHYLKTSIPCIGDFKNAVKVNKHIVLDSARRLGLKVPDFMITTDKKDVVAFAEQYPGGIITKPLNTALTFNTAKYWYPTYTTEVSPKELEKFPDTFQASLFQELIEKKVDVRIFYLYGKLYSMAIFSQNDPKARTDFRVYNHDKPARSVPFNLPEAIGDKICRLMESLQFESGSIDMVYARSGEYYFLEINPIGQFAMVSGPCNYHLEKKLAQQLIQLKQRQK